jgi:hypothetical protein
VFIELTAFWCERGAVGSCGLLGSSFPRPPRREPDVSGMRLKLVLTKRAMEDVP